MAMSFFALFEEYMERKRGTEWYIIYLILISYKVIFYEFHLGILEKI
jgi:hypothetical protein